MASEKFIKEPKLEQSQPGRENLYGGELHSKVSCLCPVVAKGRRPSCQLLWATGRFSLL